MLLKDLLVGCGSNRGCDEGDEETRPTKHNALVGGGGGQSVVAAGSGVLRSFIHHVRNPDELGHRVLLSIGRFGSTLGAKRRAGRNRWFRTPVIGSKPSVRRSEKGPTTNQLGKREGGCLVR